MTTPPQKPPGVFDKLNQLKRDIAARNAAKSTSAAQIQAQAQAARTVAAAKQSHATKQMLRTQQASSQIIDRARDLEERAKRGARTTAKHQPFPHTLHHLRPHRWTGALVEVVGAVDETDNGGFLVTCYPSGFVLLVDHWQRDDMKKTIAHLKNSRECLIHLDYDRNGVLEVQLGVQDGKQ